MDDPLSFARAARDDVPGVQALVRAAYAPYIERIGREPAPVGADYAAAVAAGRVLLARRDSRLLGVLVTEPRNDHLLIENVAIAPEAQGTGVGGILIDRAEEEARALGLSELRLYTNAKMTENLSYYPRHGFREVGRRREDGFDRVYFSRSLVAPSEEGIASAEEPLDEGPFFHGTIAVLHAGDLLTAGRPSNYRPEVVMNHIYFTALPDGAGLAAELAAELAGGDAQPHVYEVEPTGEFEDDPNVTDKKFPGNPTRSYRSSAPLRIVDEVTGWTRLTPEALRLWRERLVAIPPHERGEILN